MRSGGVFAVDGNHMSKPFGGRGVRRSAARAVDRSIGSHGAWFRMVRRISISLVWSPSPKPCHYPSIA